MTLKCIALDDEPLALGLISSFIEQTPFLQLSGSFSDAVEALDFLHKNDVDVIFMDIQMPGLNGMELARVIHQNTNNWSAKIIFTTAFSQYAIEGYKVNAIDYLLKPYSYEDFLVASQKALAHQDPFSRNINTGNPADTGDDFILLKVEYHMIKVALKDIIYVEGMKDYVKVFTLNSEKPIISQVTLKTLEQRLPNDHFLRIQRSFIIAPDKIKTITRGTVQIGNTSIPVGDQYKEAFNNLLTRWM